MQPYYIHTANADTTKYPSEQHAHNTEAKQVKYLGLHLDTEFTWKQHTKAIISKIQTTRRQMHWLTS